MADVDYQLRLLRRQYLQVFEPDFLAWPHPQLLRRSDAQAVSNSRGYFLLLVLALSGTANPLFWAWVIPQKLPTLFIYIHFYFKLLHKIGWLTPGTAVVVQTFVRREPQSSTTAREVSTTRAAATYS